MSGTLIKEFIFPRRATEELERVINEIGISFFLLQETLTCITFNLPDDWQLFLHFPSDEEIHTPLQVTVEWKCGTRWEIITGVPIDILLHATHQIRMKLSEVMAFLNSKQKVLVNLEGSLRRG